ncbi:MAG TPA: efflux RND transporter periplasmic adaptor subunit [Polyangia bacterium]|nr:efflux RND transporter periplasmic adaptor subunit [Polyangia bacterium]
MTRRAKVGFGLCGLGALLALGALRGGRAGRATPAAEPASPAARRLEIPVAAREKNRVEVAVVERTRLAGDLELVGTVAFHEDHYAVVGPLVGGRISRLWAGVGDRVKRGQVMAEIESAEVGQARADLLAAKARLAAAEANLRRETELAAKKISSERERELAEAQRTTEQAGVQAATLRLRAIGLGAADVADARREPGGGVPMRAPLAGTVIERKVTLGQAVERATDAFTIADTSHVWVTLDLYEKDLFRVAVGQAVELATEARPGETFRGRVAFVVPVIDLATRTAKVRLEFENPKGLLQAGQLVTARLLAAPSQAAPEVLAVPRSAVERIDGKTVVFVQNGEGFDRRNVLTGSSGGDRIEIREGLSPGDRIAVQGAFLLKSELLR